MTASAGLWRKSEETELWLKGEEVEWVYVELVPLKGIDFDKSYANQARVGESVDEDYLQELLRDARAGDSFPAPVAYRPTPRAKYIFVDGVHRGVMGERLDVPGIDLYDITGTGGVKIDLLTKSANAHHGKRTDEAMRLRQAVDLVTIQGLTAEDAARRQNVEVSALRAKVKLRHADRRAARAHIPDEDWEPLTDSHRTVLAVDKLPDEILRPAARLVRRAAASSKEASELVKTVTSTSSVAMMKEAVEQYEIVWKQKIDASGGGVIRQPRGRQRRTPKQVYGDQVKRVLDLPWDDLPAQFTEGERDFIAGQARDLAKRFTTLADDLAAG